MAHLPRSIEDANKPSSTPKQTPTQPVPEGYKSTGYLQVHDTNQQENFEAESIRTEPIFASTGPKRVPVQKKSRYHRYGKSTGMKAVGRSKAFWFLRRYQCQLLKEVWEDVEGSAMSHKGYSRIWPLRPEIEPMSRTVPMYASSTRSHFVSPIPYLTEAGRKSISRKVPSEQLRNRFQAFWKNMARISWIRFYNERHAMRKLWYGDLWWAHCHDDAGIGYKPQGRETAAHPSSSRPRVKQFDEIPYYSRERHNPSRPKAGIFTVAPGGPFAQTGQPQPRTLARDILEPVHSSGRQWHTFRTVKYIDSYSPHMDTSVAVIMKAIGDVPLFHGGGTTSIHQVNDTFLHQRIQKEYKKYVSSKNTGSTAVE